MIRSLGVSQDDEPERAIVRLSSVDRIADELQGSVGSALNASYRGLGRWYLPVFAALEALAVVAICVGATWLISRYRPMSVAEFALVAAAASGCGLAAFAWALRRAWTTARPGVEWTASRSKTGAEQAWRSAVDLPLSLASRAGVAALALGILPSVAATTIVLDGSLRDVPVLLAVAAIAVAYAAVLHVFALELALRPVAVDIARSLPPSFRAPRMHLSLRWKLLLVVPLINVISGVAVAALAPARAGSLGDLGATVMIAAAVAATVAFVLSSVVGGAILGAVSELARRTRRVRERDFSRTVAVSSADELGALGDSFNEMVAGLSERAVLRDALGTYVHPGLPERVAREGLELRGEEFDVTIVFADLVDFTSFAASVDAAAAVERVNRFFEAAVPAITRRGGHVDKFVGDGILAVFGAPERIADHADRALAAACEIARLGGDEDGWRAGVGVNSGRVIAGTIGAAGRYDFTVIGDAVNVAAHIEHATRSVDDDVLVTAATCDRLTGSTPNLVSRGEVEVHGKRAAIPIYAPHRPRGRPAERSRRWREG